MFRILFQTTNYCGIIIVRGVPMFVTFLGNHCPQIYILTIVYARICLIFIYKVEPATNEIMSPQTKRILATNEHWPPTNEKWFHSTSYTVSCRLCFYKWKGRPLWLPNIETVGVHPRKIEKGRDEERDGERKERERAHQISYLRKTASIRCGEMWQPVD